ncbi:putative nucleotide-binding alpha-beta plait domain superfamily, RNA-binding domain superfamily [Helianthus anomalus]
MGLEEHITKKRWSSCYQGDRQVKKTFKQNQEERVGFRRTTHVLRSFFGSRLPNRCNAKEVGEVLIDFGEVVGVYIARKRDRRGYCFGFASFKGVGDPVDMEMNLKNIWMGNYKLHINMARFAKENVGFRSFKANFNPIEKEKYQRNTEHTGTNDSRVRTFVSEWMLSGAHQSLVKEK